MISDLFVHKNDEGIKVPDVKFSCLSFQSLCVRPPKWLKIIQPKHERCQLSRNLCQPLPVSFCWMRSPWTWTFHKRNSSPSCGILQIIVVQVFLWSGKNFCFFPSLDRRKRNSNAWAFVLLDKSTISSCSWDYSSAELADEVGRRGYSKGSVQTYPYSWSQKQQSHAFVISRSLPLTSHLLSESISILG